VREELEKQGGISKFEMEGAPPIESKSAVVLRRANVWYVIKVSK